MAIFQSEHGKRRKMAPTPEQAGQRTTAIFDYTFDVAFAFATDKVEIGVLPAGARVVDMIFVPANLNGNFSVGIMSGVAGAPDDARTVGAEFLSATALASAVVRMSAATGFNVAPLADVDRGIGVTGSADITASGTKTLRVIVDYIL